MELLKRFFGSGDYMPHGFCYLWNAHLVWLHLISDSLIALSYFAIPVTLVWCVKKRRDLPFHWMFLLFGAFIVACGMTHVMDVWTLWHANYWLAGGIKAVTAAASVSTAILLTNLAPRIVEMPGVEQLLRSRDLLEREIGDLRNEEMRLRIRERTYREQAALLDITHDAIFVRDMQGQITYWNRAAEELYGWQSSEVAGRVAQDLLRKIFPKPLAEIETEILATGEWQGELTHHRKDGTPVVVSSRWALQRDSDGKPTAILESNRDITTAKRHEKRFEKLLEAAPDGIVAINDRGSIELVNAQTEKLFGYSRGELIGTGIEILIPEPLRRVHEWHRAKFMHAPHVRAMGVGLKLFGRRKDRSEFPVEISLSPLETESGTFILSVIRDVTVQRESTEKIQNLNRALEQKLLELNHANGDLESFSYSVSHDLRAPLRHIDGFARILQDDHASELSPEAARYLTRIVEGANRMGYLIDDLLALGRVGRKELSARAVDLDEVVRQVVAELPPGTESRQIHWSFEPLGQALCDAGLVKLVFSNLLLNAVKFTRTRQTAEIQVGKRDLKGTVCYFVRDNGVGFDPKYADKLFGVFQRLHSQQEFEGTGVGLATVRRVILRHNGDIWAESQPNGGATFTFTLTPCSRISAPQETEERSRDGHNGSGNSAGGRQ
jgi:PAS domain S-box-containing protein